MLDTTPTTPAVDWKVLPGETTAHAFRDGPGWMRSACGDVRWTVLIQEPTDGSLRCGDCGLLVEGAPGEITEAYGR